jgi:hypothetical protein
LVSDGGVMGTHAESTLHFFVGDECALIGVGSALIVRRYFWVRAGVRLDGPLRSGTQFRPKRILEPFDRSEN